ncbi:putative glycine dehydrogenase (decarboxylating) subunit 2 [subsurface metagenome]
MKNRLIFQIPNLEKGKQILQDIPDEISSIEINIPENLKRIKSARLPQISEPLLIRHYNNLSKKNFGVDNGFYPLGSCTMKYNPKINEVISRLENFANIHPYQDEEDIQGALQLMYELDVLLCEITGMDKFTLQPSAGAHGELTGLFIINAYHREKGNKRKNIIIPDSAHGTNPASVTMAGYNTVTVDSDEKGKVDIKKLSKLLDENTAGLMLTNPNTLGFFDENILKISERVHDAGGLVYYDGANLNAIMGIAKPRDMGFDIVHLNLHKTFSTPHGGGGPGSGPIGVKKELSKFLPVPTVEVNGEGRYYLDYDKKDSIGKVKAFYGNFNVLIKAYSYILSLGAQGLKRVSQLAVLNANYLKKHLNKYYYLPYPEICMHEFVISAIWQKEKGIRALDIAKRLMDFGFHPPTIYFPLIVKEALMIEPTETENKETLDMFIKAMKQIAEEADENPEILKSAPHKTPVKRLDEVKAAKDLILKYDL